MGGLIICTKNYTTMFKETINAHIAKGLAKYSTQAQEAQIKLIVADYISYTGCDKTFTIHTLEGIRGAASGKAIKYDCLELILEEGQGGRKRLIRGWEAELTQTNTAEVLKKLLLKIDESGWDNSDEEKTLYIITGKAGER
jgi:hypothetical protein